MPETRDLLPDYLEASHRLSLGELFRDYRVTMVSCCYFRNQAPWSLKWRRCQDSFFLFPTLGTLSVRLESGVIELKPGRFLMLNEGVPHALEIKPGCERLHQVSIHCHISNRWGQALLARCDTMSGDLPTRESFFDTLKELTCLMNQDPEVGQPRGEALIKELLGFQLARGLALAPMEQGGDPRVAAVLQKMEQAFASSHLSVEGLAEEAQITSVHLRKLFKRETSLSPKRFLNRLRLRHAARLLRQTNASVKQVAGECGFTSDHYFHLAFRTEFGCTPSYYRLNRMSDI
jgi:AraC-like DNA-binding protein